MDLYPFVLSPKIIEKLGFMHQLAHARAATRRPPLAGQGRRLTARRAGAAA
jgi:hypothetical protein